SIAFDLPNGTYSYTIADVPGWHLSVGSYTGSDTLAGAGDTLTLTFTQVTYALVFSESGLPSGTTWSVTVGTSTLSTTTTSIAFDLPNGTYSYTIADVPGWHLSVGSYSGSETLAGAGASVALVFSQVTYTVTFSETGLPSSTSWQVTLGSLTLYSTTSSIVFAEANGTYAFTVGNVPGWHLSTGGYAGSVGVAGANVAVHLRFIQERYSVIFSEVGLPPGTTWQVTVGANTLSSTTNRISFVLANGSYSYAVADVPGYHIRLGSYSGTVTVAGNTVKDQERFAPVRYQLSFVETGLPTGTTWSVRVGSHTVSSAGTKIAFTLGNGTYSFAISAPGYTASPSSGSVTLAGAPVKTPVTFT
ncbi:MAG TPA: hypothetical protein VMH38_03855, partial [Thermoplasmata archaeon]|nr:hypothetical protein [Thermoplasmata archaeon]